jgi:hypothetical protein
MRYMTLAFLAVCAAVVVNSRPATADDGNDDLTAAFAKCDSVWTAAVGSTFLHRSDGRVEFAIFAAPQGTASPNVIDFDLGWAAGPQIELTRHIDSDWDVGVRYFSVDSWNASVSFAEPGTLRAPMMLGGPLSFFEIPSINYTSRLYSTELNVKRALGERLHLLAGFRIVELHESIASGAQYPTIQDTFSVRASNYLYGYQMGVEGVIFEYGRLQFDGGLKAGVYGNHIRGTIDSDGPDYYVEETLAAGHTSFVGEIDLNVRYQFNRHWSVYGGYQLMWLQGVMTAGDYYGLLVNPSADYNLTNGSPFYHGAQAGLELAW